MFLVRVSHPGRFRSTSWKEITIGPIESFKNTPLGRPPGVFSTAVTLLCKPEVRVLITSLNEHLQCRVEQSPGVFVELSEMLGQLSVIQLALFCPFRCLSEGAVVCKGNQTGSLVWSIGNLLMAAVLNLRMQVVW